MYDLRIKDGYQDGEAWSPCLSVWEAHSVEEGARSVRWRDSRAGSRLKQTKAVTSVAYLPGRGSKLLASAGCANAKVKLWDLRYLQNQSKTAGVKDLTGRAKRRRAKADDLLAVDPLETGIDVTHRWRSNRRCVLVCGERGPQC